MIRLGELLPTIDQTKTTLIFASVATGYKSGRFLAVSTSKGQAPMAAHLASASDCPALKRPVISARKRSFLTNLVTKRPCSTVARN